MKGFMAGVIFTLVAESVVAVAVIVKGFMEGADKE